MNIYNNNNNNNNNNNVVAAVVVVFGLSYPIVQLSTTP
jgi:hypothetical protein